MNNSVTKRYIAINPVSKILLTMFRLLVVGKTETIAKETAEWAVSGEKVGEDYEKKYDIAGRTMVIKAIPTWTDKAMPVCDGLVVICKSADDLPAMESIINNYMQVPIKFILYDGASDQIEYEVKWNAKGFDKKTPVEFVEKLIDANNVLVKLVASVFNAFDKDHSGFIDVSEIEAVAKELGSELPKMEVEQIVDELDTDKDGKVSMEEFVEWWKTGRKGKADKLGGFIKSWLQKNPIVQQVVDAASSIKEHAGEPIKMMEGSMAVYVNKGKALDLSVEIIGMTKGKALDSEFQAFSGAVELKPKEPFVGIGFGAKNPKAAREKFEELVNNGLAMAKAMIPQVETSMNFVEIKHGETSNKSVMCITASTAGSSNIAPIIEMLNNLGGVILPDQQLQVFLGFATDLSKLITEDKPFYELLMNGASFEVKSSVNPKMTEVLGQASETITSLLAPGMHPLIKERLESLNYMNNWLQSGKLELEFEVDEELKSMIKSQAPAPMTVPLKDLKAMIAPQAQEVIAGFPLAEDIHKLFKEEVSSIEIFVYLAGLAGLKLTVKLPGLSDLLTFQA